MPPDVFALLLETFDCLEREAVEASDALKRATGPLRARLATQGRARIVAVESSRWILADGAEAADVEISFDRSIVLDLAEARLDLEQALISERLGVTGPVDAVARLHEALMIYLEGLMRAPGAERVYRKYCET